MKKAILILVGLASLNAHATSSVAKKAAANMLQDDVRTVVREIENTEGNPCLPEGKSFQIDLQVKHASFDYEKRKVVYTWETAKSVAVDKDGKTIEVCAE